MTEIHVWINAAYLVAPAPETKDAPREDWARYYIAQALGAHAAIRDQLPTIPSNPERGSRPEIGLLSLLATASTTAAIALLWDLSPDGVSRQIWELTPELGALNGEYVDWLAEQSAALGINPAQLYPWFDAADFEVAAR